MFTSAHVSNLALRYSFLLWCGFNIYARLLIRWCGVGNLDLACVYCICTCKQIDSYMHWCFSFCLYTCSYDNFLMNRTLILLEDKLSPVSKHGFFWSEENVILNNFPILDDVWVLVCPVILWTLWCIFLYLVADFFVMCFKA